VIFLIGLFENFFVKNSGTSFVALAFLVQTEHLLRVVGTRRARRRVRFRFRFFSHGLEPFFL